MPIAVFTANRHIFVPKKKTMCFNTTMYTTVEDKNNYQKLWMRKRRAEAVERLGGKCAHCGETEQLEFDHIDPKTKLFKPSQLWSRNKVELDAEIAKCQLLCYACHKKKTIKEMSVRECGTVSNYNHGKCRCDLCRAANREYTRQRAQVKRKD